MKKLTYILVSILFIQFQADAQFLKKAKSLLGGNKAAFGVEEAASALKEALIQGTSSGVDLLSVTDGYFKNLEIKIPFPPEAKSVENKLRGIGLGREVDQAIESINRAAEKAAIEAKELFIDAIKALTIEDAMNIVAGEKDAATQFLQRETTTELQNKFSPIIKSSLDEVGATKHWGTLVSKYNKIPFVKKINPDLTEYATSKAIDGLFVMIAQEELNIRDNPAARTTELLKKVFN
jgi:Protein of unknown function (DUF4197)